MSQDPSYGSRAREIRVPVVRHGVEEPDFAMKLPTIEATRMTIPVSRMYSPFNPRDSPRRIATRIPTANATARATP